MEIDDVSWAILMVLICLNAARDSVTPKPAPGEADPEHSHLIFIAMGYVLMFSFVAIFARLRFMTSKLLRLGGCTFVSRGVTGGVVRFGSGRSGAHIADMKAALRRLKNADEVTSGGVKSLERLKQELHDWEEANSFAAKHALKNETKRVASQRRKSLSTPEAETRTVLTPPRRH